MTHTNKWIIVFLIYADFRKALKDNENPETTPPFLMNEEMKVELNFLFKDMLNVPLDPERTRLFAIMDRINYVATNSNGVTKAHVESKTILYQISNPKLKSSNEIIECRILDNNNSEADGPLDKQPVHQSKHLEKVLKEIEVAEDEKVLFVTWDHGSAFGIFREEIIKLPRIQPVTSIANDELSAFPYLNTFWKRALKQEKLRNIIPKASSKKNESYIQVNNKIYLKPTGSEQATFEKMTRDIQTKGFIDLKEITSEKFNSFIPTPENTPEQNTEAILTHILDPDVAEILSNEELKNALVPWLNKNEDNSPIEIGDIKKRVSVLLMMNCWMMNYHTMFAMKDIVECLVAPQGDISTPGYNYRDIFKYLFNETEEITSQSLAVTCVETADNKRAQKRAAKAHRQGADVLKRWKIFAMDLQKNWTDGNPTLTFHQQKIKSILTNIKNVTDAEPETKSLLKYMRLFSFNFSNDNVCMVDLVNWLLTLREYGDRYKNFSFAGSSNIITLLQQTVTGLPDLSPMVLASTKGEWIYTEKGLKAAMIPLDPTGFGIYFPFSAIKDKKLIKLIQEDRFLNEHVTEWKDVLEKIGNEVSFANLS